MIRQYYNKFIDFFRKPTREDGYNHAKKWIEDGIYSPDELYILSDGSIDETEFDKGIRDYLILCGI